MPGSFFPRSYDLNAISYKCQTSSSLVSSIKKGILGNFDRVPLLESPGIKPETFRIADGHLTNCSTDACLRLVDHFDNLYTERSHRERMHAPKCLFEVG